MYDLGDTVPLTIDVLDEAGAPTTAGSVVLTIELPDGTSLTPSPTSLTPGRYVHDFVPTVAGRHLVRWASTDPATAYVDVLDVRGPSRSLISLDELRRHLNKTGTADDEELRGYAEAATEVIERHLGTTVVRQVVTGEVHRLGGRGRRVLQLARWPVQAVTAITSQDGAVTYAPGDWLLDRATGLLTGPALGGDVAVSYIAGPTQVSPSYALAAQIIAAHLFETQRGQGPGQQVGFGGEEILTSSGQGYAIPHRAMELLGGPMPLVG